MRDSEILGRATEIECQLAFTKLNIVLSQPITPDSRYDYIADINNHLYRIQCKTALLSQDKNSITFNTCSTGRGAGGNYNHKYTQEEIDYFYTCYNGISYLVPINEATGTTKTLRFEAKENHPTINWAKDYELSCMLMKEFNYYFDNNYLFIERRQQSDKDLNHCVDCGVVISNKATRCNACQHKLLQVVDRPSREELKEMIRTKLFTEIGKNFGVADNTIRKWCKSVNLPSKKTEINQYSDEEWDKI